MPQRNKTRQRSGWNRSFPVLLEIKNPQLEFGPGDQAVCAVDGGTARALGFSPKRCKLVQMRRTVNLDSELETELSAVVSLTKEKPAVVIRQALRVGLPTVANRFQSPQPAGYFADDYGADKERVALESVMGNVRQKPER